MAMPFSMLVFIGLGMSAALSACVVQREANLYPLNVGTAENAPLKASMVGHGEGHGILEISTPEGENFKGEYSILFASSVGFGTILASATGSGGSAVGSGLATNISMSGRGEGTAILAGDKGTSIQCEFLNNNLTGHGYGGCKSSKGTTYKMVY